MGDDWKATPVSSSELIQLDKSVNFFNMHSVEDLQAAEASAPAFHRIALNALKASGKVRDDGTHAETITASGKEHRLKTFNVGAKVIDKNRMVKAVIIQANAGYTKKSRTPVHRIAAKNGESWLAKQSDLGLIL